MRTRPTIIWGANSAPGNPQTGFAAQTRLADGDEALLSEAINFFNLEHGAIQRVGWTKIQFLLKDMTEMRADMHDGLFEYLLVATHNQHLFKVIPSSKLQALGEEQKEKKRGTNKATTKATPAPSANSKPMSTKKQNKTPDPVLLNHQLRTHLLVRALLLQDWRESGSPNSFQLRPLKWDEVSPGIKELRDLTRRSTIEASLRASFGDAVLKPLGGDQGLVLDNKTFPQGTLSERIYSQVGAAITRIGVHAVGVVPPSVPGTSTGTTAFTLHNQVKDRADSILASAYPAKSTSDDGFPKLFGNWFDTLDVMEEYLATAAQSDLGVVLGAPWGLAMTAMLRAWLVDAFVSVLMCSMPLSRLHDQNAHPSKAPRYRFHYPWPPKDWLKQKGTYNVYYNGTLAVGLWECMSGKLAPHPNKDHSGFLTKDSGDPLLGVLSGWDPVDMTRFWGINSTRETYDLASSITGMVANGQCILWTSVSDSGGDPKQQRKDGSDQLRPDIMKSTSIDGVFRTWTAHPRFFRNKGDDERVRPKMSQDEDQTGTLFSQLSLFAFTTIAESLQTILKFPERVWASSDKGRLFGSGSLMWGGANYNHSEHRFGCVYDITHKYIHPPWEERSVVLTPFKPAEPAYRAPLTHAPGDNEIVSDPRYDEYFYKKKATDDIVTEALEAFRQAAIPFGDTGKKKTAGKKDPAAGETERETIDREILTLDEIEKKYLLGTPLQYTRKDDPSNPNALQINLTGHVALLLAAPWKLINASPLMHLRAVMILRSTLPRKDLTAVAAKVDRFLWPEFYFFPVDHNDHWHVNFGALPGSSGDPTGLSGSEVRGEGKLISEDSATALCRFWRDLGVPIHDFATYLTGLTFEDPGIPVSEFQPRLAGSGGVGSDRAPSVTRAEVERKMLLRILNGLKEPPPPRPAPAPGTIEKPETAEELAKRVAKWLADRRATRLAGVADLLKKGGYFVTCEPGKLSKKLSDIQRKTKNVGTPISRVSDNYSWMEEHPDN